MNLIVILFAAVAALSVAGLPSSTISRYDTMVQKVSSAPIIVDCLSVLITMSVGGRRPNLVRIIRWVGHFGICTGLTRTLLLRS